MTTTQYMSFFQNILFSNSFKSPVQECFSFFMEQEHTCQGPAVSFQFETILILCPSHWIHEESQLLGHVYCRMSNIPITQNKQIWILNQLVIFVCYWTTSVVFILLLLLFSHSFYSSWGSKYIDTRPAGNICAYMFTWGAELCILYAVGVVT
jgi:hypothetical protein